MFARLDAKVKQESPTDGSRSIGGGPRCDVWQ